MKGISLTNLKRYLKHRSEEELINEISELFAKFENVKDYYSAKLSPGNRDQILQKYKAIIEREFFPARGFGKARLSTARKAISDYKKVATSKEDLADIMLFYVEMGAEFTTTYGDINEAFYCSMESMYEQAIRYICEQGLQEQFIDRCAKIVEDTSGVGWGFYDTLDELYNEYTLGSITTTRSRVARSSPAPHVHINHYRHCYCWLCLSPVPKLAHNLIP
ncbi:MAG TPA: DUF6155 family protein [Desulfatiglandales bacterium]|nr:DUF6155 family protein [Desulfatiglandales bacterium]